ncbi:DUF4998 domain-containing protein [Paraflavisolibacter sp. H34]|uniref:DUF4998 domain-containing protein n=1 Tax=Huijunlia imazamoxiresistens TaxID=3127457 RepID=UPI0030171623
MKKITAATAMLMGLFALASCSKWDEYKEYTAGGETLYTGKLDSVKVYSGNQRVQVLGLLPADPKITKTKITWNDGRDSAVYDITKGVGIDSFKRIIPVTEGIQVFKIQNFDAAGNSSLTVTQTGVAYGPKYAAGLSNRPVSRAEVLANGSAEVAWDSFDTTTGVKGTWVRYTRTNNNADSVFVPVSQQLTTLPDFKAGTSLTLRTKYLPKPTAIDTFYSAAQTVGVMYDVTSRYIVDAGPGFANSAGGNDRWQTPTNWITTADVRNGGNNIGGLDNGSWLPSKALSIEAWWGMTAIPNGKVYQTVTLPAGKYTLVVTAGDCSSGGTKYITVAAGSTLPDIASTPNTALAYKSIDKFADNKLSFTLANATQVSIGIQANMTAEGNFMKVFKVRLFGLP